jgi:TetR/AcrR family transcriptional regulator, mexCD-oprJ operon repressor
VRKGLLVSSADHRCCPSRTGGARVAQVDGPATEALERILADGWQHLARYQAMTQAVSELLSPEAVTRTHQAAHHTIASLLARGQADGSFRTDLPASWLVHASIALIHACNDGVRAGRIDPADALRILITSIRDLFTGTSPAGQKTAHD